MEDPLHNADQAYFLLTHPLNVKFWADIEQRVVKEFTDCPARDDRGRLELQNMLKVVRRMQAYYQEHIDTGKIARAKLKNGPVDEIKERFQRFR